VQSTKLQNGLTVVSLDSHGNNASLGFYVGSGSRADKVHGSAHVLQAMAFRTTTSRSTYKLRRDIDNFGGVLSSAVTREGMSYGVDALRDELPFMADALADAVMQPRLTSWEVSEVLAGDLESGTPAGLGATIDEDAIHAAAFGLASPLGHALAADEANYDHLTADTLRGFLGANFVSGNAVIVANNVPHAPLVDMMQATFLGLPDGAAAAQPSAYEGGVHMVRAPGATTVLIGFQGAAANTPEAAASKVLAAMIGHAPFKGKDVGMFGSIAATVAGTAAGAQLSSIRAFNFNHSDSGLIGVGATTAGSNVDGVISIVADLFKSIASGAIEEKQLNRARAACKMAAAEACETRAGARDALAASFLATGTAGAPNASVSAFDAVTAEQVAAVAKAALASDPSLAVRGMLEHVPRYDKFAKVFA
jgi:predicted Zn-dependent peptidase